MNIESYLRETVHEAFIGHHAVGARLHPLELGLDVVEGQSERAGEQARDEGGAAILE